MKHLNDILERHQLAFGLGLWLGIIAMLLLMQVTGYIRL